MNSHELKYKQARLAIMKLISSSGLSAGDRLLSQRKLAEVLPFGEITIRHALNDLVAGGVIVRKSGSGTYLAQELKNDKFRDYVLFINVYRTGEDAQGCGLDPLRIYLASHGIGLTDITVSEFGAQVTNAVTASCLGIITTGWLTHTFIEKLKSLNLPIVIQGNNDLQTDVPSVTLDLERGAYRMTSIMQRNGLGNVALFRGEPTYVRDNLVECGYRRARTEAGLEALIMRTETQFDYNSQIAAFMAAHQDIEGILMEHRTFWDFSSWAWRENYHEHPAIGFVSIDSHPRQYVQNEKFFWLTYGSTSSKAAEILLNHVILNQPLRSYLTPPVIHGVDDDQKIFITPDTHRRAPNKGCISSGND